MTQFSINNDLLFVSYFMNENGWDSANKSSYQRILYFSAALSPIFIPHEKWAYGFSNTMFGPYNEDISKQLNELFLKGLLNLEERKRYSNRIEERYKISRKGIDRCDSYFFKLHHLKAKVSWLKIIVMTLSIYGESFLSKIIKEDPNVVSQNMDNVYEKIILDDSDNNVTKAFFDFLRSKGQQKLILEDDSNQEYLLLFFDILYRKYKGGHD
ncbi:hypothetical protein [Paenibacillus zanthoxyli]|uniref:hypothetical protein n=1 Tax=Paenibacillus zanthoxyli TaxID=369399 RepID=UPI00047178CD|nr:hypothetical protein [Paenibacillus zanthoxyli]